MINKANISLRILSAKENLKTLSSRVRKNPATPFIGIGLVLVSLFILGFSGSSVPKSHPLQESTIPFLPEGEDMIGVKESIDPRDMWTSRVEQKVQQTKEDLQKELADKSQESASELAKITKELDALKLLLKKQEQLVEEQKTAANLEAINTPNTSSYVAPAPSRSIGLFTKDYGAGKKKNIKEYVTSGSFARAVLMTGVVVGTGSNSASNPEPLMMRLTDAGIFSKGLRTEQIKEAILIGDCSGDLSSERAKCRLQTLSLENTKGEIIERPVHGWIVGEDGRNGVKGIVVDKSSDMLRMAMLNGVLGGMAQFLQNQSTKGVFPVSPITGQQNALSGASTLKGGIAHGAGDAFSKMADFVMERFNSMSPQIVIASGREVDVVFQHGVDLNSAWEEESTKAADGNLRSMNNSPSNQAVNTSQEGFDAFKEAMAQMKADKENKEEQNAF